MEEPRFDDAVVLVTGAGRGIGRAASEAFAARGARVAGLSQSDTAIRMALEIDPRGEKIFGLQADVADPESAENAVARVLERFGRIDVLVQCAGVFEPAGNVWEVDAAQWLRTVSVNLGGAFLMMRFVLPQMVARRSGRVINLAGGGAASPLPRFTAYGSSKAAVVRLSETAAEEARLHGVTVNVIAPGSPATDMRQRFMAAGGEVRSPVEMDLPIALILFLASDSAAHITGKFIHIKDDYREWTEGGNPRDFYTMRRIDPWILQSLARG